MPVDKTPRRSGAHPAGGSGGAGVSKALVGLILALLVGAAVILAIWLNQRGDEDPKAGGESSSSSSEGGSDKPVKTPKGLPEDASGLAFGEEGTPVLTLFEDFQCPGCGGFEAQYGKELNQLVDDGKLQVVYHPMTFLDDNIGTDHSVRATNAALCAADADAFRKYHDTVFANQPEREGDGWTDDELKGFGKDAGLKGQELKTFEKCVDEGTYADYARKSNEKAFEMGVTGTPSVFLNGERIDHTTEDFLSQVESAEPAQRSEASVK
ncbi:Thioredoxin [Kytococcus aerolatus]|uniref:Thioredoxin n=1 Tax=Kytococcus aerolatus TaxID=592308 RepID=A0A212T054_9MICO|nr:thioredoxin domain-containing protein [Kytococcus aerolatus]SNC59389.1 Thioredoxin [Kytococcus aerolatus]